MKKSIRIGSGAGFSGDRLEPAVILAEQGKLDYLVLECLAERTIALAQKRKIANAQLGYDPLLEKRLRVLLPSLIANKVTLITNMGAANPQAAAEKLQEIARELKLSVRIAAVMGDDVLDKIQAHKNQFSVIENGASLGDYDICSANAYLGVEGILEALQSKAQIIITGRVADPSLFLAPMMHEFHWKEPALLGAGTVIGHLLECAGQLTGGYFADPQRKSIHGLLQQLPDCLISFPLACIPCR